MKKYLFILAAAALGFASCSNDDVVAENTTVNQQKEIAFMALTQPSTRAAVSGTEFTPTTMQVAAYDATSTGREFFASTTFTKGAAHITTDL